MEKRQSPRRAIQNWLARNGTEDNGAGNRRVADDVLTDFQSHYRHRPSLNLQSDHCTADYQYSTLPHAPVRLLEKSKPIKQDRSPSRYFEDDHQFGLAERLELHAPFRQMEARGIGETQGLECSTSRRKRRRVSSSSSYLEPAVAVLSVNTTDHEFTENGRVHGKDTCRPDRLQAVHSSDDAGSGELRSSSPAQPVKLYERKLRHKTKEDKYELKHDEIRKHTSRDEKKRKTKRRLRKEKTGSALLHNFAAENVTSERLTLRPSTRLGLFTKGRASSPIRRGGLPDLSFSEVNFLSKSKETSAVKQHEIEKRRQRTEHKMANDDDEISRFFASRKTPLHERDGNSLAEIDNTSAVRPVRQSREDFGQPATATNRALEPVDMPIKPFLGFGAPGPHPSSSIGRQSNLRPSISPIKQLQRKSPSISASYLTWSTSLDKPQLSPRSRIMGDIIRSSPDRFRSSVTQLQEPRIECFDGAPTRVAGCSPTKSAPGFGYARDHTAVVEASQSQAPPTKPGFVHITEMLKQIQPGSDTDTKAEDKPSKTPLTSGPQIDSCDTTEGLGTLAPLDPALYHAKFPMENSERSDGQVLSAEQNTPAQFAAAMNQFLEQWKDKVQIPAGLANGVQLPCASTSRVSEANSLRPWSPKSRDSPINDACGAHTSAAKSPLNSVSAKRHSSFTNDHIRGNSDSDDRQFARSRMSNGAVSGPSRGSTAKSQPSRPFRRVVVPHIPAHSPFQDSTYSTCRGGASIYEHQISATGPQPWPHSTVDQAHHSLDNGTSLVGDGDRERHSELLLSPRYYRKKDRFNRLVEPAVQDQLLHRAAYSILQYSSPRHEATNRNGFELCLEPPEPLQDLGFLPSPARNYHDDFAGLSATPLHQLPFSSPGCRFSNFQGDHGINRFEEDLGCSTDFAIGHDERYQFFEPGPHVGHASDAGEDIDQSLVGFWKPNPLY
ncbi:hypothetical protein MMC13_006218 [Lambiella insularis]|nr:hypothetical protein [Lambiella insularis]